MLISTESAKFLRVRRFVLTRRLPRFSILAGGESLLVLFKKKIYIYICIYRSRGLVWKQFHFADLMERLESLDLFFCNVVFLICSFRSTDWPPYHTRQLLYHLRIKSKLNYHVKTLSFPWFISSTRRFSRFLANGSVFPTPPRFRGNHNKRT